jgi:hypothetical protein
MCTVSDKLKLCTCKTKNVEQLKHYWKLKRESGKKLIIIGQSLLPANIGEATDRLNEALLLQMLNTGNCFDVTLQLMQNDLLELFFTLPHTTDTSINARLSEGNFLCYTFRFHNSQWIADEADLLMLSSEKYTTVQQGTIKKAFDAV